MKYFEIIHQNNIPDRTSYTNFINAMTRSSKLGRNTIEHISELLREKKLIKINDLHDIYFHKELKKLIYEIFSNTDSEKIYETKIDQ